MRMRRIVRTSAHRTNQTNEALRSAVGTLYQRMSACSIVLYDGRNPYTNETYAWDPCARVWFAMLHSTAGAKTGASLDDVDAMTEAHGWLAIDYCADESTSTGS